MQNHVYQYRYTATRFRRLIPFPDHPSRCKNIPNFAKPETSTALHHTMNSPSRARDFPAVTFEGHIPLRSRTTDLPHQGNIPVAPDPPESEYWKRPRSVRFSMNPPALEPCTPPAVAGSRDASPQPSTSPEKEVLDLYGPRFSRPIDDKDIEEVSFSSGDGLVKRKACSCRPGTFFAFGLFFGTIFAMFVFVPLFFWGQSSAAARKDRSSYFFGALLGFALCLTWISLLLYFLIQRDIGS